LYGAPRAALRAASPQGGERFGAALQRSLGAFPREQPAALFEDPIGARIEFRGRLFNRKVTVDETLGHDAYLGRDALPLGHLGRRLDTLQLIAEGAGVNVGGTPSYNLLNRNGYYCMKVNVNDMMKMFGGG